MTFPWATRPLLRSLLLLAGVFISGVVWAENVPPTVQNTTLEVGFDRAGIPARIDVWRNLSAGYNNDGTCSDGPCTSNYALNTLVCLSPDNPQFGACPIMPRWYVDNAIKYFLTLDFMHEGGEIQVLTLNTSQWLTELGVVWAAAMNSSAYYNGMNVSIPAASLDQLKRPGRWTAHLKMQVMTWGRCSTAVDTGCPGEALVTWEAHITLNVSDTGTQTIFFPAFKFADPRIDLNLTNRPGTGNNTRASGSNTLDMCLYDGSNSLSNRISLLFQDEGDSPADRPAGRFSIYRDGADRTAMENRIDYQVTVINPTTGSRQTVNNGTEINWTGTNSRGIQREVMIHGVPGPVYCVPAPLTFTTPEFPLAEKNAGHYSGTLRIVYTPTTYT